MVEPEQFEARVEELTQRLDSMLMQWLPYTHGLHDLSVEGSRRAYDKRLRPVRDFARWFLSGYTWEPPQE